MLILVPGEGFTGTKLLVQCGISDEAIWRDRVNLLLILQYSIIHCYLYIVRSPSSTLDTILFQI